MIIQKIKQYTAGQQGYVFVLVAVILPLLFAAGALAVDVGYAYVAKTALQNAADAAALAGAAQSDDDTADVNSVVKTYIQRNSAADNTITVSSSESTDASIPDTENSIYALTNAIKQTNGSTKVVHLSRQKIRYFLMNFMLLHNQLTRLDNTSQPAYDGGWKNGFVQNCKCGYSA